MDFDNLSRELLARSESVVAEWLPAGKRHGREYRVGNLHGEPGESLSINLETGVWRDFASGDGGADLISLYAAINRIGQGEAHRALTNGRAPVALSDPRPAALEPQIIVPVPVDAPEPSLTHRRYGNPSSSWRYLNATGDLIGIVARYDPPDGRKQIIPWVWTDLGWTPKAFPKPRPLYGLRELAENSAAPVMVVEGEKAAEAARSMLRKWCVVTWPGGAQAHQHVDWTPLHGRRVTIWPDADDPGRDAAEAIAARLHAHVAEIRVISVDDYSDGWDAADAADDPRIAGSITAWAKPRVRPYKARVEAPATQAPPAPSAPQNGGSGGPPDAYDWARLGLRMNSTGKEPLMNLDNVVRVIQVDPDLGGHLWYDEFLDSIVTDWQGLRRTWCDADDIKLQLYVQRHIGLHRVGAQTCHDAALVAAMHDVRNEVQEYLDSLAWDGFERLADLFPLGFGADRNEYTAAVGRCWMISMVARVFIPGCKVDTVPVLEGDQGRGKSSGLGIIGGKWYTECHESVLSKDFFGVLQGHMLVEISEMHAFTRAEVERVKGIISCQVDRYRKAYGRNTEDHPRQTVLACTTNRDDWQRDDTGARRFWPIRCGAVDQQWLHDNRDQLFAEACHRYGNGESWWNVPSDLQQAEVEMRREEDSWEPEIRAWLVGRDRFLMVDLLRDCIGIELGKQDQMVQKRAGRLLRQIGWNNRTGRDEAGRVKKMWMRNPSNPF